MKFQDEKKNDIKLYILEKIRQKSPSVAKKTAENYGINASTVSAYINEMIADDVIKKIKRDVYETVSKEYVYDLSRNAGDLEDDTYAFETCLKQHIKGFDENIQHMWSYAFTEMINNVMDHSMAENVRIIIRQDYVSTCVQIIDNGVGIFRKIMEYFHFASADEAICELFKGKLTTDAKNHSGEGIFFSSKMMDEFYIISNGKVFTNNKFDVSRISDVLLNDYSGTCVVMELSNFSRRTAKDVFDEYADMDEGGFVKTRIPIKNIFEASPVSRSQAKRVCNRLEKFREVIVDFTEVPWVGQGFAHQLFVVFADEHPEIVLSPINMNEDVMRMYRHVTATGSR